MASTGLPSHTGLDGDELKVYTEIKMVVRGGVEQKGLFAKIDIPPFTWIGFYQGILVLATERKADLDALPSHTDRVYHSRYDLRDPCGPNRPGHEVGIEHYYVPVDRKTGELLPQFTASPALFINEASEEKTPETGHVEIPNVTWAVDVARNELACIVDCFVPAGRELTGWYGAESEHGMRAYTIHWTKDMPTSAAQRFTRGAIEGGNVFLSCLVKRPGQVITNLPAVESNLTIDAIDATMVRVIEIETPTSHPIEFKNKAVEPKVRRSRMSNKRLAPSPPAVGDDAADDEVAAIVAAVDLAAKRGKFEFEEPLTASACRDCGGGGGDTDTLCNGCAIPAG